MVGDPLFVWKSSGRGRITRHALGEPGDGRRLEESPHASSTAVRASPDGARVLVARTNTKAFGLRRDDAVVERHSDWIEVCRADATQSVLRCLPVRAAEFAGFAIAPDGRTLAVATPREIIVYAVPEGL